MVFLTTVFAIFYNEIDKSIYLGQENKPWCGVNSNEEMIEGRKLFKSLCASCHKLDKKLIGPAIGDVKMNSLEFYDYITAKKTKHEPIFSQLTIDNTNDIFEYIKN